MPDFKCSFCGKPIEREGNPYRPFCSEQCQHRDLGNWLDERYGLPWEDPRTEDSGELWREEIAPPENHG